MNRPTKFIPFSRPLLEREEEEAVISVLRSGWLTTGKVAARFEAEFAAWVGTKHALAVNSGTSGLHLCLEAVGVKPKSLVVTSPYTFAATAEVIRYLDADPLFVDIEEETYNLSPVLLKEALKKQAGKVSALIPVHIAGYPCNMEEIGKTAAEYGIPVIEDAAHAMPVTSGGRRVGTLGDLGVFSFYATKPITTGEGGMVVTDRDDLARRIRIMRLHGFDRDAWDRYTAATESWYYQVVEPGYKYNLSDLAASIGLVQLTKAGRFLRMREKIASRYLEGLSDCNFLSLPKNDRRQSWHLFMIKLVPERLTIDRDRFVQKMLENGVGVSVHFIPLHIMPYYRKRYGYKKEDFPVALKNFLKTMSLPIYPGLTDEKVSRVIRTVRKIGSRNYRKG